MIFYCTNSRSRTFKNFSSFSVMLQRGDH